MTTARRPGVPRRWGLEVFWGGTPGSVRFRCLDTGEWQEVEAMHLRSEHAKVDLRWMARRAAGKGGRV